jgi:hypothetical protein
MAKSLLFLPDISGFTEFVQTTEVAHSQHVISELLEVLIDANTQELQLAEVEGDALFFIKKRKFFQLKSYWLKLRQCLLHFIVILNCWKKIEFVLVMPALQLQSYSLRS